MYHVLISEARLIWGRNTAIFSEGFLFAILILDYQRDDLFSLLQTLSWDGDLPAPNFPPTPALG